ncbi:MAG: acetate--CoA ligase family protein, partial [Dehalococcoidales bacterium]|nr:acetate--CoA ligase family protein [Dehalococcoidales bacterium]
MFLSLEADLTLEKKSIQREEKAAIASLKSFLTPRSVAVIGASPRATALGNRSFTCLLYGGFKGTVYPVNSKGDSVAAVKAYSSIMDVPGEVDLAVIVVPADAVQTIVEQCGRKGVRGIVVISAGFGEAGPEGIARQNKLLATVRSYGMRMVGPNCMGIINTAPEINMNATFAPVFPPNGRIAFGTQSGGLGLAILEYAKNLNIGLSTFVSIGNRADVSSNDLLQYWKEDPATDVILLYLESFGNPRKFAHVARNVTVSKPVVVVKSGRTAAGARAAASHTGAMASTEVAAEALFKQAGIVRVSTLEELFDTAIVLANQPVPRGRKVAIITNGGGPGILTADACADKGLEVPILSEKTRSGLKKLLSPQASVSNPVDMTADASYNEYKGALQLLVQDENVDIAIAILVSPVKERTEFVAKAIREVAPDFKKVGKTLISSFMGQHGVAQELVSKGEIIVPSFTFPEASAIAIAKACEYGEWLKKPKGNIPELSGIDREKAQTVIKSAREKNPAKPLWLDAETVDELLRCYGVKTVPTRIAANAQEAARIAGELGYPVALKLYSKTISHKTEVGGVALNLHNAAEVSKAYQKMKENLSAVGRVAEMQGVTVQPMVTSGTEMIVGVTQDPSFGPLMLFGMGGVYTELFKDVSMRIHPLTDTDAKEMVRSVKAFQLLEGWRGSKRQDVASIEELLLRISAMLEDIDEIKELDLNPVKVQEEGKGYIVVDARILLT